MNFKPSLVIAVEGIQKDEKTKNVFYETMSSMGIASTSFDYSNRNIFSYLFESSNDATVDRFHDYYQTMIADNYNTVDTDDYQRRPSVIAHGFGTFIVGYGMLKYQAMKFDKIIFCGCILPRDFDWQVLISRDQVNFIRNECGTKGFFSQFFNMCIGRTGDSGIEGFNLVSSFIEEPRFEHFRQSDFLNKNHIKSQWSPILHKAPSSLVAIHGRDINIETDFDRYREDVRNIDEEAYGPLQHFDEARLSFDEPKKWMAINPDIYTLLKDRSDDTIKGYINASPIEDKTFSDIKQGKYGARHLEPRELKIFEPGKPCKLYFMSIAIAQSARKGAGVFDNALLLLAYGLIDKLLWYATHHEVVISEIVAIVWKDEGEHLCKLLGMREVATDKYNHKIYWSDLKSNQNKKLFPRLAKLIEIYGQLSKKTKLNRGIWQDEI